MEARAKIMSVDPVWTASGLQATDAIPPSPLLGGLVHSSLLHHTTMEQALAYRFSLKLGLGDECSEFPASRDGALAEFC